jgi:mono/diheme cytochrome c family protein
MMHTIQRAMLLALLPLMSLILAACGNDETASSYPVVTGDVASAPSTRRQHDFAQVSRGGQLFLSHCAECHGQSGEGAAEWRQRNAQGRYPAPPLNGTGHAWHHPYKMLAHVIINGSPGGQGDMPAWRDKLTDQQIEDVMAWFISKWPDEIYAAWQRMNQKNG